MIKVTTFVETFLTAKISRYNFPVQHNDGRKQTDTFDETIVQAHWLCVPRMRDLASVS